MAEVITITPTIGDGTVVRWYLSEGAAVRGDCVLSASRNRVTVGPIDIATPERWAWLQEQMRRANDAYVVLRNRGDVSHMATHKLSLNNVLEAI